MSTAQKHNRQNFEYNRPGPTENSYHNNFPIPSSSPWAITAENHNPASLNVSLRLPINKDRNGKIIGYVIQYTRVGSSDMMSVNVSSCSGTTHMISGLVAYVNYSVIVAAVTVNGTGPFSDPLVVGMSGEDCEFNQVAIAMYVVYIVV